MKLILLLASTILITTSCHNEYEEVLNGLSNNHVLLYESMGKDDYLKYFDKSESIYKIKVEEYSNAVELFYGSDKEIINHLLTFENDSKTISNWISTPNPLSSILNEDDLFSNSQAALILIDNFLLNGRESHISNYRLSDYGYQEFKEFYKKYRSENLFQLRKSYRDIVENK